MSLANVLYPASPAELLLAGWTLAVVALGCVGLRWAIRSMTSGFMARERVESRRRGQQAGILRWEIQTRQAFDPQRSTPDEWVGRGPLTDADVSSREGRLRELAVAASPARRATLKLLSCDGCLLWWVSLCACVLAFGAFGPVLAMSIVGADRATRRALRIAECKGCGG